MAGLSIAKALNVDQMVAHSDSQLIVNQVLGTYEAKDEKMAKYLARVKKMLSNFNEVKIRRIPRLEN